MLEPGQLVTGKYAPPKSYEIFPPSNVGTHWSGKSHFQAGVAVTYMCFLINPWLSFSSIRTLPPGVKHWPVPTTLLASSPSFGVSNTGGEQGSQNR
jgi:hypothetical protein